MSRGFKHRLILSLLLLFSVVLAVAAGFISPPPAVAVEQELLCQLLCHEDVILWGSVGMALVLLGFGLFLVWNRGLHAEVKRRKVTERALFDSVLQYRHLVQSVPHGIVEIGRAGEILFNNEPFCQLIGVQEKNLQGHSFAEFVVDKEQLTALLPQLTAAEAVPGHFTEQLELRSRQGQSVAVQIDFDRSQSVLDVQSAIIIITDLTRSLTAEKARDKNAELARELRSRIDEVEELNRVTLYLAEDLRSSNAELQQKTVDLSEVNRDLESFSYSVSHDLRAPLRHIMGFAEILSDAAAAELSADNRRYLDKIKKSAGNMSRLINDLLTFSRAGRTELTFSEVDTDPLVKEEIENFAAETAGRQIDWQVGNLPVVTADLGTLRQVFNNLLENAVKYSSTREQAVIKVEAEQTGDEWVFAVHDNGAGFNPELADKLFKVFSRLHRQEQFDGTGVGLAIVRRILQRHGGRIWAQGAVDQGAGFYFSLPIVKRAQS